MSYEQKAESGSLFRNDRKEKPTQPDYKGDALIGGKLYWLSAWLNESPKGTKYMSLKFNEKERKEDAPAASPPPAIDDFEPDEKLPF
jgi:hypothetical protein